MRRMTPILALAAVLVAAVAAGCGGGGDSGGGGSAQETEYADAIATSFLGSDAATSAGATDENAQCVGNEFVSIIGVDKLEAAGTPDSISSAENLDEVVPDITEDQAGQLVDAIFECVDVGEIFASQIASGTGVTLADDKIQCLADNFQSNEELRSLFAQAILTGDDPNFDANPDTLTAVIGDCLTAEDLMEIGQANQ